MDATDFFETHREWALAAARIFCRAMKLPAHQWPAAEQGAMIGLWQASKNWRPDGGAAFKTFARRRIRGSVLDALRGDVGFVNEFHRLKQWQARAAGKFRFPVFIPLAADHLRALTRRPKKTAEEILELVADPVRREVLRLRIAGWSTKELAARYGKSDARVCQILLYGLNDLRAKFGLPPFPKIRGKGRLNFFGSQQGPRLDGRPRAKKKGRSGK